MLLYVIYVKTVSLIFFLLHDWAPLTFTAKLLLDAKTLKPSRTGI